MNDDSSEKGATVYVQPVGDAVFGEQDGGDVQYTSMGW